ncbi:MAG: DUF4145 domain-containing protein [Pseudomonadales bacterium]
MTHYSPEFRKEEFNCPYCGVYASQSWADCTYALWQTRYNTDLTISRCAHCNKVAYWNEQRMLIPSTGSVELPASDMPDSCKKIFIEARDVVGVSPKGAAALLRLCLQQLMVEFGQAGKNINADIAELVKQGLPPLIQQSLDICRVVGNNAVHPGEINLDDSPEIAYSLFKLINLIVHDRITRPNEVQALYETLPSGALEVIEKRDS